jgi:hypothetical protein
MVDQRGDRGVERSPGLREVVDRRAHGALRSAKFRRKHLFDLLKLFGIHVK